MDGTGSRTAVVPLKPPNKTVRAVSEVGEEGACKVNAAGNASRTQSGNDATSG